MNEEEIKAMQERLEALEAENKSISAKNAELLDETKQAKARAQEEKDAAAKAAEEAARKSGDVEALDKSWTEKHETEISKVRNELQAKIDLMTSAAEKSNVTAVAQSLAGDIFVNAELGIPHIQGRIGMQMQEDGSFKTVVKDANGDLSAMTIDELKAEIMANELYKPILKGSQGGGGGAPGAKSPGKPQPKKGSREDMKAAINARLNAAQ